ncbi:MAG: DUF932 domain-containing protein [Microcystis sp. M38BS1]|uniref:DUF932 domain-containing protein n=1 Tax=Microcystis sp. M38BS1 TaxID=2771188 RepID=UPI0031FD91BA|nr:DUF932 domain-containing protein [Microcystis sp. M38BS1]MCA6582470.1 DUF932 domain-containing protein [Pseudanabaena sp. M34BS1SP1A06MG]
MTTATVFDNTPKSLHVSTTGAFGQLETSKVVERILPQDIIDNLQLNSWLAMMHPNLNEDGEPVNVDKSQFIRQEYVAQWETDNTPLFTGERGRIFALKVSKSYNVLQYPQGIKWLEPFTDEGLLEIEDYMTFDSLGILAVNCRVPNEVITVRGEEDKITPYFILSLSHDGVTKRGFIFSDFRVICKNTLYAAIGASEKKLGKFFSLDKGTPQQRLVEARKLIDLATLRFHEKTLPELQALNNLNLERKQVDTIFRDLLNVSRTAEVPTFLEEDEKYPANIVKLVKLNDAYNDLSTSDIFNRDEHTGYKVLNAVTGWQKYLGKQEGYEPSSAFKNNIFGSPRKKVVEYLEQLLPVNYRE